MIYNARWQAMECPRKSNLSNSEKVTSKRVGKVDKKVKFECIHHKIAYISMNIKKGVLRCITRGIF